MKRTFNFLLLFALLAIPAFAEKVSRTEAQRIAQDFLAKHHHRNVKAHLMAMPRKLMHTTFSTTANYSPFYVYNVENNGGFVIVSGDDAIGTIIGYSDKGTFDLEGAPSNVVNMMKMFANAVERQQRTGSTDFVKEDERVAPRGEVKVKPLLNNIQWGQDAPFFNKMPAKKPTENNPKEHYYVGCVATAMAQIMRYHKWPVQGTGNMSYTDNLGKRHDVDFTTGNFDWTKMPERLEKDNADETENDMVATLSSLSAFSVHMSFMPSGEAGAYSQAVTGAMVNYFGYDTGISYKRREYYSTPQWIGMIKAELDAGRPVFYSATNEDGKGGHAFVCDGYDSEDYFHFNWGWYGKSNGYFRVNALEPYSLGIGANGGGYNLQQEIITGIKPLNGGTPGKKAWAIFGSSRIAVVEAGGQILGMQRIDNHDCDKFIGKVGLVLIDKNNEVKAVLKEEDKTFAPVNVDGNLYTTGFYISHWVKKEIDGNVPNGSDYRIQFAVKANGSDDWQLVLSPNNLPNYGEATVEDNKIVSVKQHEPVPNVTLMKPITAENELHAKGSGKFTLVLKNNSDDFYLNHIWLKFTSVNDESKVYYVHENDKATFHQVYDNSEKTIQLLCELPNDLPAGKYKVTAFEKNVNVTEPKEDATEEDRQRYRDNIAKWESYPFKPAFTEDNILEVLEEITTPVFYQESEMLWISNTNKENNAAVKQGDIIAILQEARNYGATGNSSMLMKAVDVTDNSKVYDIIQTKEADYKKMELAKAVYSSRLDLAAGKYSLVPYYVVNGIETPMGGQKKEYTLEVLDNDAIELSCTEFTIPTSQLEVGKRTSGFKLKITARKAVKGVSVYVRLRPATRAGGMMAFMKSVTLEEGKSEEYTFSLAPEAALQPGKYLLYAEYRPKGKKYGQEIPLAGHNTQVVYLGVVTGIDEIQTTGNEANFTINGNVINFNNTKNVRCVEVYNIAGTKAFSTTNIANSIFLPIHNGVYVVRIITTEGTITKKIGIR